MGSEQAAPAWFWNRYPSIPAVRNHRVYGYDQNAVLRPGPRVAQTLLIVAALTHPEAFAADSRGGLPGSIHSPSRESARTR
jgi:ABC-type Fe3+-hydroxamate transport system substrate-binding protein